MDNGLVPVMFAVFVWWASTGLLLYLNRLAVATFKWSLAVMSVLAAGALFGVWFIGNQMSVTGVYLGFVCGILIWAWHEMTFLMGVVTGTRTTACPADASGAVRFRAAFETILWHELAILATGLLIVALTWGAANKIALWTYCILWAMRTSAKLNLFLGVRNLSEEFLPHRMRFLASYFRRARMNAVFPVSLILSSMVLGLLVALATTQSAGAGSSAGYALLAALLALAILEHLFMVLPVSVDWLWRWGLKGGPVEENQPAIESASLLSRAKGSLEEVVQ